MKRLTWAVGHGVCQGLALAGLGAGALLAYGLLAGEARTDLSRWFGLAGGIALFAGGLAAGRRFTGRGWAAGSAVGITLGLMILSLQGLFPLGPALSPAEVAGRIIWWTFLGGVGGVCGVNLAAAVRRSGGGGAGAGG